MEYLRHGYRLHPQMRKLPMIFPGEMAATTVEPFKSIIAYLDELERRPEVLCASCYIGFAWTEDVYKRQTLRRMEQILEGKPARKVPHEEFKRLMEKAKCVIRTGETSPYANVILIGGVNF